MHVYFSGIGGTGLFPLALVALDVGYQVSGSDIESNLSITGLQARKIDIALAQDREHIKSVHQKSPIDWLVVSSAVPEDSPEIAFAKAQGIRVSKRDELLLKILDDTGLKLIAVSGTHGKTTTSAMIVWLSQQSGQKVSYICGSKPLFGPSGQYIKGSKFFIYEADEYDRNFLSFKPDIAVITAVDYDHPDTYPTEESYKEAFRKFIDSSATVYAWAEDIKYLEADAKDRIHIQKALNLDINLAGEYNRRNASLACQVIQDVFHPEPHKLAEHANKYPGTERRLEKLAENIFTDYAHHPTEIKATLAGLLERFKDVVIVYQPHQNLRQHLVMSAYSDAFNGVKKLYWLPTYLTRERKDQPILAPEDMLKNLDKSIDVEVADLDDQLAHKLQDHLKDRDYIVFMGAGPIDSWARQFSKKL